ncbi:hypothetical protein FACS189452_10670 [Bacteroidia bacterium]|nr:hypothetical protein FACS189452_10670 [Bacteroidia bacterium]
MYNIDLGRKKLAIEGGEIEGRRLFSKGLLSALSIFKEIYDNAIDDIAIAILAEHAYLTEERRHCGTAESGVLASMTQAIASFNDALRVLKIVQNATLYQGVEKSYPRNAKYRYHDMPKDAFHIACNANRTRINNTLRTPGINNVEREVYEQRSKNMTAIQAAYLSKQQTALSVV